MNIPPMLEIVTKGLMDSDSDKFNELVVDWYEWFWKFMPERNMAGKVSEQPISWILHPPHSHHAKYIEYNVMRLCPGFTHTILGALASVKANSSSPVSSIY